MDETILVGLEPALRAALPFRADIRALTVVTEDEAGIWRTRWRIPLGARRP
ncbi:MAG: hypothetical protein ACHQ15_05860 [Candidatus Limnocylindrales bacterium]